RAQIVGDDEQDVEFFRPHCGCGAENDREGHERALHDALPRSIPRGTSITSTAPHTSAAATSSKPELRDRPITVGATKPASAPPELIMAIPPAAAFPRRMRVNNAQAGASDPQMPIAASDSA